ncbi:hypothetical protein B1748_25195 [Paenibacillus sp. MY03]|uniref:right-handed parallel beta-helix repeat-containing protein n=1 Tax=Paenibacillus sp. MY03 TaxID=302980 RepID=UPI000B3C5894|nr:right-handed parallel beta-helix repeat-containing protein [Paenibacillus sp. MY03]OUS72156.1 hypothetical protein B1748_25195 [Paenibacillus sp. MY03]
MEIVEVTVGHQNADIVGTTNTSIQMAVDRVASLGGGVVRLLPGTYIMHDSLHLRSHVHIQGSGDETILWKPASVSTPVIEVNGYGMYSIKVKEPEKFSIGMGIHISDKFATAFYTTVATVCWKRGNELGISRQLNHDIAEVSDGSAVSIYPIVSGCDVEDVVLDNFIVDGNAEENEFINGCRGGGVYFLRGRNIDMRNLTVRNYNGDGISFQACVHTSVENSLIQSNKGSGLHPGSGSVGFIMRRIVSIDNEHDGLFYCLRVSYSLCEECLFENNKRNGISIGHADTDAIIRHNTISNNGGFGLVTRYDAAGRSGDRTLICENVFRDNGHESAEIMLEAASVDMHIVRNQFMNSTKPEHPRTAVYIKEPGNVLHLHENPLSGLELVRASETSFLSGVVFENPQTPLPVEHQSIPHEATLHLKKIGS